MTPVLWHFCVTHNGSPITGPVTTSPIPSTHLWLQLKIPFLLLMTHGWWRRTHPLCTAFPNNSLCSSLQICSQMTMSPGARRASPGSRDGSFEGEEEKNPLPFPENLFAQLSTPASLSGCYWQPGNHIFLVPDIIIIINIGYLSHSLVSKSLKLFLLIILSSLTWWRMGGRLSIYKEWRRTI